ncbi:MAG: hypothetical protein KKA62_00575 [Nanoarchaeota archaeon]|nr:hypothetical protein [Nanoarchaeota archaeon]MBU1644385.1 hypothetical protein [Nanoarchaeota archaeon]MBU1976428.1 hypothetical protein [Nanoarchaeota archaeon]
MSKLRYLFLGNGITMGSALAMILSYVEHHSILWALLHGLFSWIYVIYFVIVYRFLI